MTENSAAARHQFEKDITEIKLARLASNEAITRKDVDTVSKFWLADFIQVAGDGSHTIGKKKIVAEWKYMFSQSSPLFERLPDEILISESGDSAWEKGTWNYKNDIYFGSYSAMWHKIKGQWFTKGEFYVSLN